MKPLFLILFPGLILLGSCGGRHPVTRSADSTDHGKDPTPAAAAGDHATPKIDLAGYQIYARRKLGIYSITLLTSNGTVVLLLKNTRSGKTDTLAMEAIQTLGEAGSFALTDVSQQLGGDKPSFLVEWQGDSDATEEELIGYEGSELKELVHLPITGGLRNLRRLDGHTLEGDYSDRDELIANVHDGYRLRISLPDYQTTSIPPDTLILDNDSQARDTIQASRILPGKPEGIPYTIMPGTPLHIDTFFHKGQLIRLHIGDSIVLQATLEEMQSKVKGDDAG